MYICMYMYNYLIIYNTKEGKKIFLKKLKGKVGKISIPK